MSKAKKVRISHHCYSELNSAASDDVANASETRIDTEAERWATPVQNFPCAAYSAFMGKTGPMVFVSEQWTEWTGCPSEELCQDPQAWPRCIHPDDRARAQGVLGAAHRDGTPYSMEYRVVHKDTGQVRYVRDQGLLGEDKETDIARVDGIVTDITELKKLEDQLRDYRDHLEQMVEERTADLSRANHVLMIEDAERTKVLAALKKSEQRLRTIFENVTDVICYVDSEGKILDVNSRIEDVLGYKPEELIGKDLAAVGVLRATDVSGLSRLFKRGINRGKRPRPLELELRHKSGSAVFAEVDTKFIKNGRAVIGIVTIIRDVTERRRTEQSLRDLNYELRTAIRRLTVANRELADFARIAAHDLKAPLRGIGSLAGIVAAEYSDKLDMQGRHLLETLVGRASRMYSHMDSILQYSQIGRVEEKKRDVDLNELLRETAAAVAPPTGIVISVEKKLPTLVCEKSRMATVFANLVGNAVKYMDKPDGRITVDCVRQDGLWKFSVSDNGPGIEEKYFDKIFQMFQTLASRDQIESTGIGLAVVKKIVENAGGNVWLESQVGQGTTFFFTWPGGCGQTPASRRSGWLKQGHE